MSSSWFSSCLRYDTSSWWRQRAWWSWYLGSTKQSVHFTETLIFRRRVVVLMSWVDWYGGLFQLSVLHGDLEVPGRLTMNVVALRHYGDRKSLLSRRNRSCRNRSSVPPEEDLLGDVMLVRGLFEWQNIQTTRIFLHHYVNKLQSWGNWGILL